MKFEFRPADKRDINFLLDLRKSTMGDYLKKAGLPVDEASHLERVLYRFEHAKIVYLGTQAIGLLKYSVDDELYEIIQIQIHPHCQNKGYGSKLIEHLVHKACDANKPISLSVLKPNPAFHLYARLGFRLVSENRTEYTMIFEPKTKTNNPSRFCT